ncbi:hypothetical protein [Halocella sp. SP3-1]|uniref:hypothetical protein n=1 Tax=Halocella sp. SP3-1 TaxID=2382161 RepID=UPI000F764531|nr:hypothetical protein [Halocella sp. SP3-1]AZO96141.1 hypothetical protein D7D81_16945 [Halocella sp. SP3-1]
MKSGDIIKIGPYDVKLSFADNLRDENDKELYGIIHHTQDEIEINTKSSVEKQKVSILHEVMHGIDVTYQIGLSEEQTEVLATGIYQVLKDNDLLNKEKWEITAP